MKTIICRLGFLILSSILILTILITTTNKYHTKIEVALKLTEPTSGIEFYLSHFDVNNYVEFECDNGSVSEKQTQEGLWIGILQDIENTDEAILLGNLIFKGNSSNYSELTVTNVSAYRTEYIDTKPVIIEVPAEVTLNIA